MNDYRCCPQCQGTGLLEIEVEPQPVKFYAIYRPQYKPRHKSGPLKLIRAVGRVAVVRKVKR